MCSRVIRFGHLIMFVSVLAASVREAATQDDIQEAIETTGPSALSGNSDDMSPVPLLAIDKPDFTSQEFNDGELVEDWLPLAMQLEEMQQSNLSKIRTIYCEEWRNHINFGTPVALVVHHSNWWDRDSDTYKLVNKYPPRTHANTKLPLSSEMYRLFSTTIRTPEMLVRADLPNYETEAEFGNARITAPRPPSTGLSNLHLKYHWMIDNRNPTDFWAETIDRIENGFYMVSMRRKGTLVQMKLFLSRQTPDRFLLWIFDLEQGGFAVYRENQTTPRAVYVNSTQFGKVGNCWVPLRANGDEIDFIKNQWLAHCERTWYRHRVNIDLKTELEIKSLPMTQNVQIVDSRTGEPRSYSLPGK